MINSMTGYGEAQGQVDGVSYIVELKTLNNRYLKTIIRLPESVTFLEEHIDKLLHDSLSRGTINYVLRLKGVPANALFEIDRTSLKAIIDQLDELKSIAGVSDNIDIAPLLGLPGIVRPVFPDEETTERIRQLVLQLTTEAIDKLKRMRATEGSHIEADLTSHCNAVQADLQIIRSRGSVVVKEYAQRLKRRVDELLAEAKLQLDEDVLAREVAILAERSDISEEIARLDSHLRQFSQACNSDGQAGRRLDFICQEMLREANTIASKATDAEIMQSVIDMKCWIDRIKEQIQNVE